MSKVDYQTERELRKLRKQTASGGSSAWGELTGVLSNQTDLQNALDLKADDGHTHPQSDVTGLVVALAGKQPITTVLTNTTASYTTAEQSKLAGIAAGATVNSSDATLLNRANHTGTQLASTISDFSSSADARVVAGITGKQDTLVSGTNIKTVNSTSLLGSGNIVISGGGGASTQVTLTVSPTAINYKEVVVIDAAVSAVSKVECYLVGELDAENDLEGLVDDSMRVFAIAESGQIRFVLTGNGPFVGPYKVNYKVGT